MVRKRRKSRILPSIQKRLLEPFSAGVSAALLATAIGIGTALFGLLGHNILHRISDVILEEFKSFLLLSTRF